jgi:hypothetical protein
VSLWLDLRVGKNTVIGRLEIIRATGKRIRKPAPTMIFTYQVLLNGQQVALVQHRYGDGGWALVRTALAKIEEVDNQS